MSSKIVLVLGLVGAASLISSTCGWAQQVIYSDSLTSATGAALNGTSPTIDTTGAKWIADSGITRTATGATFGAGDSAYLAFTPIVGHDYTLTYDILSSVGTTYIGGGITGNDGTSQFYGNGQNGFMLLSGPNPGPTPPAGTTFVQSFASGTDYTTGSTYTTAETFTINIQTAPSTAQNENSWTETFYVDGVQVAQQSNLPENWTYVGIGDLNNSAVDSGLMTSFELIDDSLSIPEPSTWTMLIPAGLALLVFVRRRSSLKA